MAKEHQNRVQKAFKGTLNFRKFLRQNATPAENKIWLELKNHKFKNLKFRRQHGIGPYIVDFYCAEKKLVIEIDGDVHAIEKQMKKDKNREKYLQEQGLRVVRYLNNDIYSNLENVLEDLNKKTN
ncbi:MAG: endonuclease domain-containing protein [Deltaproteobacteria bacterium]|nr:endonuclease domain-containing protein [Deltaproteobacteria bacterium]